MSQEMQNSKTATTIIAEILMIKAGGWSGPFAVLEGIDDIRFWRCHLSIATQAFVDAEGVINLQQCMRSLPQELAGTVFAIADGDFREFTTNDEFAGCRDTFIYDEGFLETFLLNSIALRKVLETHADAARVSSFLEAAAPHTVFSWLRHIGGVYARMRILNCIHGWGVSFDRDYAVHKYVDENSWSLDEQRLTNDIATRIGWTVADLSRSCDAIGRRGAVRLIHGHDALKILSIGLNHRLGEARVGTDRMMADLRLAFESTSLRRKQLWKRLQLWANGRSLLRTVQ